MIVTGGDVDAGTLMAEDKILALERKAFLELARTRVTQARIRYLLEYGSPLRYWPGISSSGHYESNWAGFGVGAMEIPMVAQTELLGGNIRVGMEDNLYLERGVFASNAQLAEKSINFIQLLGCEAQTPAESRQTLVLRAAG